jgi:hypothetical protein
MCEVCGLFEVLLKYVVWDVAAERYVGFSESIADVRVLLICLEA